MGKVTQKIKSSQIRLREFSSGGCVYKKENGKTLWLVAASSVSELFPKSVWRLPKGWIDDAGEDVPGPMASGKVKADEESLQNTATREVGEEAGVGAKIISKIGTEKYFFNHPERGRILKFVTFYLMEWEKDLPGGFDRETSEIAWLSYEDALKKITYSTEKKVLKEAEIIYSKVRI